MAIFFPKKIHLRGDLKLAFCHLLLVKVYYFCDIHLKSSGENTFSNFLYFHTALCLVSTPLTSRVVLLPQTIYVLNLYRFVYENKP